VAADTTPQDRAVQALHDKFDLSSGVISLMAPTLTEMLDYTPTARTGPSPLDFRRLKLREILDCLADAGLLAVSEDQLRDDFNAMKAQTEAMGARIRELEAGRG
jgi:hypothetical protein